MNRDFLIVCRECHLQGVTPANHRTRVTSQYFELRALFADFQRAGREQDFASYMQEGHYYVGLWAAHLVLEFGHGPPEIARLALSIIQAYAQESSNVTLAAEERNWLAAHTAVIARRLAGPIPEIR